MPRDRVQTIEWFVQDQELRLVSDGLRDLTALPHSQRIGSDWPPHDVLHADGFQRSLSPPRCVGGAKAVQPDQILHPIERSYTGQQNIDSRTDADRAQYFTSLPWILIEDANRSDRGPQLADDQV